jgi:hypothetical protein
MAIGDVKLGYAASAPFTVTNLHSLPASQTWVAGWESNLVDNTTNLYLDYLISGLLKAAASNNQVGTIRVYVVAMNADATWPTDKDNGFDGTESTEAIAADLLNAVGKLAAVIQASAATASQLYSFGPFSVASLFGGVCPAKFVVYITGNIATTTAAQFAADTNVVTYKGIYNTVAAS